jgi:hypothetical protein
MNAYIPKVRPESQDTRWLQPPRPYSVAAYWADGWELRHLDWLRFHGFWPLAQAGRMQA